MSLAILEKNTKLVKANNNDIKGSKNDILIHLAQFSNTKKIKIMR